ncbi:MAG: hypothetical protein UT23_C0009G0017 [Candidatus Woesebacteria bacterium GW2011_GWA1_39_12]|uniref:Uncharacterized protein n=1 Tax=Candidatus Woesebacteria bacterium GW2011_GWA1_39_12 TaxID=1618549 RepID=A0A0G0M0K9_9BACT|nr:MAG: hypothetical protein UT23_C0009G0017 [Candidatus Woesebacteria bacterium GW2011_GWA1_39_12]
MGIENMSESSNSEFQPEEDGLQSLHSETIPEQVPQGRFRGFVNRARQKFTRQRAPTEPIPPITPETTSDQESGTRAEQERPLWEGLIFDDPKELIGKVGLDKKMAESLTGIHLMDEDNIITPHLGSTMEEVLDSVNIIRNYRENNGLTLSLPEDDEELRKLFPGLDLRGQGPSILREQFKNIDLANHLNVSRKISEVSDGHVKIQLDSAIKGFVQQKVDSDLTAKAESEGKDMNVPLAEAGESIVTRFKTWASKGKLSPEAKVKLGKFGKAALGEVKGGAKTLMFKDARDAAAVTARVLSDFSPEAGLALAVTNIGTMGIHEVGTYGKKRMELKEMRDILKSSQKKGALTDDQRNYIDQSLASIGLNEKQCQKFIKDNSPKLEFGYAASAWFNETALGKLLNKSGSSQLTAQERRMAAIAGVTSALTGTVISEGASLLVRVPGARSSFRMAAVRVSTQYILPRVIEKGATKLMEKRGFIETEEKKKEWVDLSLQSMRLTTTATATIFTGLAFLQNPAAMARIENAVEETGEELSDVISSTSEKAAETLGEVPLVKTIEGALESTPTAPEPTIQMVEGLPTETPTAEFPEYYKGFDDPGIENLFGQTIASGETEAGVHWIKTHNFAGDDPNQYAVLYDLDGNGAPEKVIVSQPDGNIFLGTLLKTDDGVQLLSLESYSGPVEGSSIPVEIKDAIASPIPDKPESTTAPTPTTTSQPTPEAGTPLTETSRESPVETVLGTPQTETPPAVTPPEAPETTMPEVSPAEATLVIGGYSDAGPSLFQDKDGGWHYDTSPHGSAEPNYVDAEVALNSNNEVVTVILPDGQTTFRTPDGDYIGLVKDDEGWFLQRGEGFESKPQFDEGDIRLAERPDNLIPMLMANPIVVSPITTTELLKKQFFPTIKNFLLIQIPREFLVFRLKS